MNRNVEARSVRSLATRMGSRLLTCVSVLDEILDATGCVALLGCAALRASRVIRKRRPEENGTVMEDERFADRRRYSRVQRRSPTLQFELQWIVDVREYGSTV